MQPNFDVKPQNVKSTLKENNNGNSSNSESSDSESDSDNSEEEEYYDPWGKKKHGIWKLFCIT
jgi:hypothetical protein